MKTLIKSPIATLMLLFFVPAISMAGTVGISGKWAFDGTLTVYDPFGVPSTPSQVTGYFDFDSTSLDLTVYNALFFGWPIIFTDGTIADNGNGTYNGTLAFDWNISTGNTANILWDITDHGDGTATVLTLDGDGDGIVGNAIGNGTFSGNSFEINGELNAVPLPAAAWLFGSGLLGLAGMARLRKAA